MFPDALALTILTVIVAVVVMSTVSLPALWAVLGSTLVATAVVAVHRSIPRQER